MRVVAFDAGHLVEFKLPLGGAHQILQLLVVLAGGFAVRVDAGFVLEVAREHGGHEHLTLPLNWQADLQPVQQHGEAELGLVRLQLQSKDG